jgi:signal transduction histidine kinase
VRSPTLGCTTTSDDPVTETALERRVLAEQVRVLFTRAYIAQATVVVNGSLVCWVFWNVVPRALALAWMGALCALAAARIALVRAYRRHGEAASDAVAWARRFTIGAVITGLGWGAAALIFYTPGSTAHQVFLAFVLGGMTAGAATSNATYTPAFVAFAAPALLPLVIRLGAEGEPMHLAMAFMLTAFGVAVAWISRRGGRTIEEAMRLRFGNEALVERLSATQRRLETLNADLERRVTERTEVLRESDRRKDEFIGVLSHELRNPLAPIRNSLHVLDRVAPGSEQAEQARRVIRRQTDHLARLVDDLLDVTRISKGKVELRRARFDLGVLTRAACDDHRALLRSRGLDLRVEVSEPLWIDADETRIAQVIGNLLQNAAKFSPRGGTVTVSVGRVDEQAEVRVRDEGIGIEHDLLPRLFESFVQAEVGLARSQGGLGLGLALTKALVELHGGSVRAHSAGPRRGSEFVVSLPLAPSARPSTPDSVQATPADPVRVLVIEDNLDQAESMAVVLEFEGHRVHIATDGRTGLAKAHEFEPEVILCDIGLPDVDGYQIARALRADPHCSARLIAVTGYARPEDRRRAEEAGFDAHIAKPPSPEALLELVRSSGKRG